MVNLPENFHRQCMNGKQTLSSKIQITTYLSYRLVCNSIKSQVMGLTSGRILLAKSWIDNMYVCDSKLMTRARNISNFIVEIDHLCQYILIQIQINSKIDSTKFKFALGQNSQWHHSIYK